MDTGREVAPSKEGDKMKYNDIRNAEQFITDQITWCKANKVQDFTVWSNGKELHCTTPDMIFSNVDLKNAGFWKAIIYTNGQHVEI